MNKMNKRLKNKHSHFSVFRALTKMPFDWEWNVNKKWNFNTKPFFHHFSPPKKIKELQRLEYCGHPFFSWFLHVLNEVPKQHLESKVPVIEDTDCSSDRGPWYLFSQMEFWWLSPDFTKSPPQSHFWREKLSLVVPSLFSFKASFSFCVFTQTKLLAKT